MSSSDSSGIRNRDMLALKEYITAQDQNNPYQDGRLHYNTLLVDLTHSNLQQKHIEQRMDRHTTIEQVKMKIHQKTGTPAHFQRLVIKSAGEILQVIPASSEEGNINSTNMDHYPLGYFFGSGTETSADDVRSNIPMHSQRTHTAAPMFLPSLEVHCIDINPHSASRGGQFEDTSLVEKYVMSEQDYNDRQGTLRDWSRNQKATDATFTLRKHAQQHRELCDAQRQHKLGLPLPTGFVLDSTGKVIRDEPDVDESRTKPSTESTEDEDGEYGKSSVVDIAIGNRCKVEPGQRRGMVAFVGLVPELPGSGYWVGVTFDEPVGKTDGSVTCTKTGKSTKYFKAMPRYGGFVRGRNVQVGDFPERDIIDELDDSDDEL